MLHSLYGSMDSSKSCETTASKPRPAAAAAGVAANGSSPTASVSESNAFASEHEQWNQAMAPGSTLQGVRFDLDIDVEVQSPDRSIWEALFADQVNPAADAGEYMMSSPKKMSNSMSCSYVHGLHGGNGLVGYGQHELNSQIGPMKGKAQQSPLHKVFSGSATRYVQGEVDLFLDDFVGEYASGGAGGPPEAFDVSLISAMPEAAEGELYQVDQFASELQAQAEHGNLLEPSFHGFMEPEQEQEQEQDSGLQLVHLLLACAEAVAKDDYLSARRYLHHLNRVVSPLGDSMQRVASCFTDALAARLAATLSTTTTMISKASPSPPPPPNSYDILKIYQILYQACPYIKFAHFTANQAIFEAFHAEARVHVIDLDILQGYQWPAFIQALAARPAGPPFLRITGVGPSLDRVRETGRHLAELAHSLRVPFEFHPVGERPEDLQPHMLHRRAGEALAVNSVCRLHRVPGQSLGGLVRMIRDQAPAVVTVVEQEASHNGPHFLGRFLEALHYYSAVFDSLDATFPGDSVARAKVEQYVFAPVIKNIVACEGAERVERHERLERWRKVMEGKGFKGVPLSANAVSQSRILLGLYSCDGYRLTEDKGCLLLGWQDRPIIAASAWQC